MNAVIADPPGPVPQRPTITSVTPGDTTATVKWTYPANVEDVDHWDLEVYVGSALLANVRVEGPTTRESTLGELTNGTTYGVVLQAVNLNGRSAPTDRVDFTPKSLNIPKPVVGVVTPWDGYATFSFTCDTPPAAIDNVHYIAKRTDTGYETEGVAVMATQRTGTTGPLDNDRPYQLFLSLEIAGKTGPYSDASGTFTPTNPVPPFPPIWAHIDAGKWDRTATGGGKGVDWLLTIAAGAKNTNADAGPQTITGYRYQIKEKTSGTVIIDRTVPSSQSSYNVSDTGPWMDGIAVMTCWAKNNDGWSQPTIIEFDVEPHADLPIDFGVWQEVGEYRYHVAEESVLNYARVNKRGVGLRMEWLIIAAGGAGHGLTTLGKAGGDGGSGQYILGEATPINTGKITAALGDGANYQDTKPGGNTVFTFLDNIVSAKGGGTSTGKDPGTPSYTTPAVDIATLWPGAQALRVWYWNTPYSQNIGGARVWDKNNAPDGNLYGQAGGGTNGSGSNHGGNGFGGLAVIRYKIADVPPADPQLTRRQERKHKRWERKLARQVRRTRVAP